MVPINGFLSIDKPAGWTSQDVVSWVRKHFGIKKVGHTGTLDPMATGVLPLCLGAYTRLSSYITGGNKQYRAVARLGMTTDSLDADGVVTSRSGDIPADYAQVEAAVAEFRGAIAQVPPMYSAIRIGGRRLYDLARRGVEVERPARNVCVHKLDIVVYAPPLLHLNVHCSKGTYIRSLADDIGKRLGCGAHLSTLRRTAVGRVELGQCVAVYELERAESISEVLLNPHAVLSDLSSVCLTEAQQGRFSNGNPVTDILSDVQDIVTVQNSRGILLGLGHIVEGVLKPIRVIQN
ncbi:MAG: tRNA pseudouridine(55) synthase TruB [Gemmatimonadetes bacterium]|nr:tRNA pseudouridine(55) synthase TruB [Gemmatimonadota bacterium]MYK50679.1 tRNA pseudouridine(55) synthase TruB [Gemmatimonadota bacterium]